MHIKGKDVAFHERLYLATLLLGIECACSGTNDERLFEEAIASAENLLGEPVAHGSSFQEFYLVTTHYVYRSTLDLLLEGNETLLQLQKQLDAGETAALFTFLENEHLEEYFPIIFLLFSQDMFGDAITAMLSATCTSKFPTEEQLELEVAYFKPEHVESYKATLKGFYRLFAAARPDALRASATG